MKKKLTKIKTSTYYFVNGEKREDVPSGIRGDLSGVRGDLSGVRGDLSNVRGDLSGVRGALSGIRGDLSGVWGDLSNVRGDLDACEITAAERAAGVIVSDLIA